MHGNNDNEDTQYLCVSGESIKCSVYVRPDRAKHRTKEKLRMSCHSCGEEEAKYLSSLFTVVCQNKQGYELITDLSMLKQLNPKRTEI